MKKVVSTLFTFSMLLMVLLYSIQLALPNLETKQVVSLLGMVLLISSLLLSGVHNSLFQIILILMAVLVSVMSNENVFLLLWDGSREMQGLFPLIIFISMIGWILKKEPYIESLYYYNSKILRSSTSFYASFTFLVQVTAYFMITGAVILVYQFIQTLFGNQTGEQWEYFKNSAIMRGYALTAMWSIGLPSFAYAITATNAPLLRTELQGIFLSLLGTILAIFFYWRYEKKEGIFLTNEINDQMQQFKKREPSFGLVIEFILIFVIFLVAVFTMHELSQLDILIIIPTVAFVLTFGYFLYKRQLNQFLVELLKLIKEDVPRKYGEVGLIICAGLVIYSMRSSDLGDVLFQFFYKNTLGLPWLNFLFILPIFILILGLIGISPMTIMILMGGVIQNAQLPYPADLIVLSLTIGSVLCLLLSPLTVTAIVMSSVNGKTPFENSTKFNLGFAIMFFILAEVYLGILCAVRLA